MKTMTQCKLVKGTEEQTTWIPTNVAKLGKTIRLKENGSWDEGWVVDFVGATISEEFIKERDKAVKRIQSGKSFNNY